MTDGVKIKRKQGMGSTKEERTEVPAPPRPSPEGGGPLADFETPPARKIEPGPWTSDKSEIEYLTINTRHHAKGRKHQQDQQNCRWMGAHVTQQKKHTH